MSPRETATILAALRYWQREGFHSCGHEHEIASDGGTIEPLTGDEIDALCERMNSLPTVSSRQQLTGMNPAHVEAIATLTHRPEQPGIDWAEVEKTKLALAEQVLAGTPMPIKRIESMLGLLDWMQDLAEAAGVLPGKE